MNSPCGCWAPSALTATGILPSSCQFMTLGEGKGFPVSVNDLFFVSPAPSQALVLPRSVPWWAPKNHQKGGSVPQFLGFLTWRAEIQKVFPAGPQAGLISAQSRGLGTDWEAESARREWFGPRQYWIQISAAADWMLAKLTQLTPLQWEIIIIINNNYNYY